MSDPEDMENQGFKVHDHRRFAPDGTPNPEAKPSGASPTEAKKTSEPPPSTSEAELEGVPADFSGLILSLAAGAQSALGMAPNPLTGKVERNLTQAKYHVDLLGLLQEKTKNNLTREEEKLLQAVLYDLRMKFLEVKKS